MFRFLRRSAVFSTLTLGACALGGITGGCVFGPPPDELYPAPRPYVNSTSPNAKPWPNYRAGQGSLTPAPAPAPRTELVNIDLSSPKAAALTYYRAMAYGDGYAARAAVLGDDLTTRYIASATEFSASVRDLYLSLANRFGQDAARSNPEFLGYLESFASPDVPRAIAAGEVRISGDTATLTLKPTGVYPGNEEAPAVFKRLFGQWRLAMLASRRLDGIQAEEANEAAITNRRSAVRFTVLAKAVRQGRFKNVEQVWGGDDIGPHRTFAALPPATLPQTSPSHVNEMWPGKLASERQALVNPSFSHPPAATRSTLVAESPTTVPSTVPATPSTSPDQPPTTVVSAQPDEHGTQPTTLPVSPATKPDVAVRVEPSPATAPNEPVAPRRVEPAPPSVVSVPPSPPVVTPPEVAPPKNVTPPAALQPNVAAIRKAHLEIVQARLAKGGKVNDKDARGRTMLHTASISGEDDIVQFLLIKGADVNILDAQGWTALHWAASGGHTAVVRELLDAGANINAKDQIGATPLHWAAIFDQREAAEVLIDRGADIKAKDVQGKSPLHAAAEHDAQQVTPLLLAKGASLKAKDDDGYTPLHTVIQHARSALADLELTGPESSGGATTNPAQASATASPELKEARETIIRHAADMVSLLLVNGADVNARTPRGQTPLHLAAWDDTRELAALLIAKGADVDAQDARNHTPLEMARQRGQVAIVQLLTAKADQ